jgi:hypothetical protein
MTPEQEAAALARIARESEERFGKGASKEKFAFRNAERAKLGLGKEKRKRGGISGVWDRNKQIIKPVVAGVAGALTGGAALPALLGAGMAGFDRPGKSGFGFDLGRGLAGAGAGALAGAGGAGLAGAVKGAAGAAGSGFGGAAKGAMTGGKEALGSYFGLAKPAPPTTPAMAPTAPGAMPALNPTVAAQAAGATTTGVAPAAAAAAPPAAAGGGWGSKLLDVAKANPNLVAGAATGISGVLGNRADNEASMARLDFEREQWEEQQLARRRLAQLLSPEWKELSSRSTLPLEMPNIDTSLTDWNKFAPDFRR